MSSTTIARLSELPADARELAAAMAVVNQRIPLPLVGRIAGIDGATASFEHLLTTGFVSWQPDEPDTPIEFSHPLYRQALYQDLSPSRRRDLHRSAARVLPGVTALAHRVAATESVDEALADELGGPTVLKGSSITPRAFRDRTPSGRAAARNDRRNYPSSFFAITTRWIWLVPS